MKSFDYYCGTSQLNDVVPLFKIKNKNSLNSALNAQITTKFNILFFTPNRNIMINASISFINSSRIYLYAEPLNDVNLSNDLLQWALVDDEIIIFAKSIANNCEICVNIDATRQIGIIKPLAGKYIDTTDFEFNNISNDFPYLSGKGKLGTVKHFCGEVNATTYSIEVPEYTAYSKHYFKIYYYRLSTYAVIEGAIVNGYLSKKNLENSANVEIVNNNGTLELTLPGTSGFLDIEIKKN